MNPNLNAFEINKVYISNFFKNLWNFPEIIYTIIKNSELPIVKEHLSDFIVNNFFCNNLNNNYMENNLLYVLAMVLKEEIEQLNDINDLNKFLENSKSKASYLLKEMIKMPDIQLYFKKLLYRTMEKIESTACAKKFNFDITSTYVELKKYIGDEKKSSKKGKKDVKEIIVNYMNKKILEQSMNIKIDNSDDDIETENKMNQKFDLDTPFLEYIPSLKKQDIEDFASNAQKCNLNELNKYFHSLLEKIENDNDILKIYSNSFLELYANEKEININYLLYIYQQDFLNVISIIQLFLEDLLNNSFIIPNSIKQICKIISILIQNKFKDVPIYQQNRFISKFFMDKLLMPMLKSPNYNALINDFILSGSFKDNILIISSIINNIFYGNLFQNNFSLPKKDGLNFYSLFNRYILKEVEKIFYFYQKAIDITLPTFIENFLNNKLPQDYYYDYFQENPDEMYVSISICFNWNNYISLIKGIKTSEKELFVNETEKISKLKRIFTKLCSDEKSVAIKQLDDKNNLNFGKDFKLSENESKSNKHLNKILKIENYYLYNDFEFEKKYENLFKVHNKISGFYIDIKKLEKQKKLDQNEKNIIKLKNYLINSLTNYNILKKSSFKSTESVMSILSQIKEQMTLSNYKINSNTNIPINWSVSSVLNYMQVISDEYKENDFEKLFNELTENIEESIEDFNFEKLFIFKKKLQFIEKNKNYYNNCNYLLYDISINEKVKYFVENSFLPIEVKFSYDDEEQKFELKASNTKEKNFKENDMIKNNKNESITFKTISSFANYFPDLNKYQKTKDIDPFQIINDLKINQKLMAYFDFTIKEKFMQELKCSEDIYDKMVDIKIKNYFMNKIYKKIYPKEPEYNDSILFEKTMHLSWVQPSMIIPGDYTTDVLDNILPEILEQFKNLNQAYSPYIKLKYMKKIFEYIVVIVKFNEGGEGENKEVGAEEITPYLNYVLIRACPVKIFSDINFIKLFSKENIKYDYDFQNVEIMCKNILDSTYKDFHISEEEYIKKCNEAINNSKNKEEKRFQEIIGRFEITNS